MRVAMQPILLEELTWTRAKKILALDDAIGLWPIGATEAHGPHLPLHTDVYLSQELCERVARALWGKRTCIVLPPLTVTVTTYAAGFAGTLCISPETATRLISETLDSLGRHGLREVALVNSHLEPGHVAVLQQIAETRSTPPRAVFANHCRKPWALELSDEFKSGDCHAGEYETSLLLASRFASQVDMKAAAALPTADCGLVGKMKAGIRTFEEMGALQAYFGHPATATKAEGERLWGVLTRMWVDTILVSRT